ncbi:MAG: hypothetical protein KGJ93_00965 [Patescibacteria group bacterium]|nr:hypothetical protein [Patescibacteria group bacterium]
MMINVSLQVLKQAAVCDGTVEVMVDLKGQEFPFLVVRQELEPRLPGFVGLVDGIVFVADSTPEQYRLPVIWSQVKWEVVRGRRDIVLTLMEELGRVPAELCKRYTCYRYDYFRALAAFLKAGNPALAEVISAITYLQGLK